MNDEMATRWWAKALIATSLFVFALLVISPLGHRAGMIALGPAFIMLVIVVSVGLIAFITCVVMIVIASRRSLVAERNLSAIALVVLMIPLAVMGSQLAKGSSVPGIHDISTDVEDVPTFDVVVGLRADAPNSLEYGSERLPAAELAATQQKAFPNLRTIHSELGTDEVFTKSVAILKEHGLEVVNEDRDSGLIEAVATTFWFGFKDDVVVRIRPDGDASIVDLRSVSRVGQGDLGANAARIQKFIDSF